MNKQRLDRLDKIAKKVGRADIWTNEQRKALIDNIDSDLEIMKQQIISMKVPIIQA